MYFVVPYKVTDEADIWSSPRCALIEADDTEKAVEDFILACVHPHADSTVWGNAANWGTRPERLEDGDFYIVGSDPTDPDADLDEPTTIMLSILEDKTQGFETQEEAEDYRDGLCTFEWAYTGLDDED